MNAGQLVFYLGLIMVIGSAAALWVFCILDKKIGARASLYCFCSGLALFAIGMPWGIRG